jgi:hypothetical protein
LRKNDSLQKKSCSYLPVLVVKNYRELWLVVDQRKAWEKERCTALQTKQDLPEIELDWNEFHRMLTIENYRFPDVIVSLRAPKVRTWVPLRLWLPISPLSRRFPVPIPCYRPTSSPRQDPLKELHYVSSA